MPKILIIDDDEFYRDSVCQILGDAGYEVFEAAAPLDAYQMLQDEEFDLIISDLYMPFTSTEEKVNYVESPEVGLRTVQELASIFPNKRIIAMSSLPERYLRECRDRVDPVLLFSKPEHPEALIGLVREVLINPNSSMVM